MVSTIVFFLDVLCYWSWRACTFPAATCWACITACCWAGLTATWYAMSAPLCILHLACYCYKRHQFLSLVPFKFPSPAAASRPASLPAAPQQQPEAECDAPATNTTTTTTTTTNDNSSPIRSKACTKATRAAPTRSDDGQGLQDTAAAAASAADQPEATATAAVMISRREACPKAAKPQASNALTDSKKLESEAVKKDRQQYEMLRACRLQNENCDWYKAIYN